MQAVEFETYISDGIIHLPMDYTELKNKRVKVSLSIKDLSAGNYNKFELLNQLKKARDIGTFKLIEDSVKWQQEI
ncbi:MAG TPA: hypothetical protein PKY56_00270 [Candidatus Kapabacteria bacterium]|nr:hypothetical protein [Candidatus Kapabacteria bacterium]HPO61569.1 hypothetical protein [Candidatus Kapabacteria bacterium]